MTSIDRGTMDPEVEAVAKQFVGNYYSTFDANRADLANLYLEESVLIFDGQEIKGKEAILAKLTSLPFQQCQHHIGTVDCLPSGGEVFVLVTGNIRLDGKQDALDFSQMFRLKPTPEGSFSVSTAMRTNFEWRQDGHLGFKRCLVRIVQDGTEEREIAHYYWGEELLVLENTGFVYSSLFLFWNCRIRKRIGWDILFIPCSTL